ncbi:hypothetical protein ENSA5_24250 [Enhygromyxa salina]|uniref:Uncharacterized protein n=1 Tax=Enhygromyxa salina TaxID=215803 RepID=A0A2S9YB47_9BACT|nr:hypothetical protein [Enhygromyxa salina]PRQ02334.1 hypothetical protein ENSA5_24250 [Enhygromyxa salina]
MPTWVFAKGGLKPDDAADQREQIQAGLASDPHLAIAELRAHGEELGDPELFLIGARLGRDEASSSRDADLASTAAELALIAHDIGRYLADETNYKATDWRPVTSERAAEVAAEAEAIADECVALAEEIEAERAAAAAEAERARLAELEDNNKTRKPGTGLIAGGSVALVIGASGLGMLGAGLSMGQGLQGKAEALALPAERDRLDELDRQGANANALAYAGGAVAAVGIAVGVALVVVGVKKRKAAGPSAEAGLGSQHLLVGGWLNDESAGLALQGRF